MLERVLEPESMDAPGDAEAYDLMDHSEVNDRFVRDFLGVHGPTRGGEVLDVGTGPARIPILLCRLDVNARVLGIDCSPSMIERALRNVEEAGLSARIRIRDANSTDLPFPNASFESVLCNATMHHFHDPIAAVAEMVRLIGPGGTLMIRDLVRPADESELARLVDRYGGGAPDEARALFAASFRAALTVDEVRELAARAGLPEEGVSLTSDRHWTWLYRRRA